MAHNINLEEVRDLTKLLSFDRANTYKTWVETGLCLHNIDPSLLDCWIEFSRRSPKFTEGECEKIWETIYLRSDGPNIASLHLWAKTDNPTEYTSLMGRNLAVEILKSRSQTIDDIAKVVYSMYKYQYKCASIKYDTWYEFKNHRWFPTEKGFSLKRKIGNEIINEYLCLITFYNQSICEQPDDQKDLYLAIARDLIEVSFKLVNEKCQENVMKECRTLFYDPHFTSLLDSNPDLIGFENGVYDLHSSEFRDGRPEDHISLSTGNDYIEFEEDDEIIVAVYHFMSQLFPDPEIRDYVLILLSSFLEGRNPNEQFHILIGDGGNGKSQFWTLFELAFGQYCAKIPLTLLALTNRTSLILTNPALARLRGIRIVSTQEPGNDKFNAGLMKDWIGGERLTCRPLYGDPFDFKARFKMVFCCNHVDFLPSDDEGLWKRANAIEFKSKFVDNPDPKNVNEWKIDMALRDKLPIWKEALMFILLEHHKIYKKHGIIAPLAVKNATREYREKSFHKD